MIGKKNHVQNKSDFSDRLARSLMNIRIRCPCNVHPLTSHFHIVKLGFTGIYIFLIVLLNIDRGYSLEPPH